MPKLPRFSPAANPCRYRTTASPSLQNDPLGITKSQLFDGNPEPRIPAALMFAASRELVAAIHKAANTHHIDFVKAAGLLVRERPALFRLTRARAVPDSDATADVEIER